MDSGEGFNMKKTLITAVVGTAALVGAGFLAYFALEDKLREKKCRQKPSSDLTVSDLSLRESKAYSSGLNDSKETIFSLSSIFSGSCVYETADEMGSTITVNNDSENQDEFFDLTSDDEIAAETLNEKNKIINRDKESKFFNKVDSLMKGNDNDRNHAFNLLKKQEIEMTENPDFLWRFAKAHQIKASMCDSEDLDAKKKIIFDGLGLASKALALDSVNPDAHKWFAILTGMKGDFVSLKEKIEGAKIFYEHLLIALKERENDYSLHYLLARFKYEVANTSWWERKIASTIFAEIPSFDYGDSIPHLMRSEELNSSPWKENRLLLAKCFVGLGDYEEAIKWLDRAKEIQCKTKEDEINDQEVTELIEKYKSYRE